MVFSCSHSGWLSLSFLVESGPARDKFYVDVNNHEEETEKLIRLYVRCYEKSYANYLIVNSNQFPTCRREFDCSLTAEGNLVRGDEEQACYGTCCC